MDELKPCLVCGKTPKRYYREEIRHNCIYFSDGKIFPSEVSEYDPALIAGDETPECKELRARLIQLETLLREAFGGAVSESCVYCDDQENNNPCWHCCDWSEWVKKVSCVLGITLHEDTDADETTITDADVKAGIEWLETFPANPGVETWNLFHERINSMEFDEVVEVSRKLDGHDGLLAERDALRAEVERLKEALELFLEWCDMPQVDPEGPRSDDYGAVMFEAFGKAEEAARAALYPEAHP